MGLLQGIMDTQCTGLLGSLLGQNDALTSNGGADSQPQSGWQQLKRKLDSAQQLQQQQAGAGVTATAAAHANPWAAPAPIQQHTAAVPTSAAAPLASSTTTKPLTKTTHAPGKAPASNATHTANRASANATHTAGRNHPTTNNTHSLNLSLTAVRPPTRAQRTQRAAPPNHPWHSSQQQTHTQVPTELQTSLNAPLASDALPLQGVSEQSNVLSAAAPDPTLAQPTTLSTSATHIPTAIPLSLDPTSHTQAPHSHVSQPPLTTAHTATHNSHAQSATAVRSAAAPVQPQARGGSKQRNPHPSHTASTAAALAGRVD